MASLTKSVEITATYSDNEENEDLPNEKYMIDKYKYSLQCSQPNQTPKTDRSMSYNGERRKLSSSVTSSSPPENNGLRHLYSRFKRRFTISKDYRIRTNSTTHAGLSVGLNDHKSRSSSMDDDTNKDFSWPDFEKVYDSIPHCLLKALPGLDSFSSDHENDADLIETIDFNTEENNEQMKRFEYCKRGKYFRRNGLCQKLDKTQYYGQLDIFVQQIMIEKLMRTWT